MVQAEKERIWNTTRDTEEVHRYLRDMGFTIVSTVTAVDTVYNGEIGVQSTAASCVRTVDVTITSGQRLTVVDGYYDWVDGTWDARAGGSDRLYFRFYNALESPDGTSPYWLTAESNRDSRDDLREDLIWVEEYQSEGGGVIWELQHQNGTSPYATDHGMMSVWLKSTPVDNSVIFGMVHTWEDTVIESISITVDPNGGTSTMVQFSHPVNRWKHELTPVDMDYE